MAPGLTAEGAAMATFRIPLMGGTFCWHHRKRTTRRSGYSSVVCKAGGSQASSRPSKAPRKFIASDGRQHIGSALTTPKGRELIGPPPGQGPPLRVLPIGGLGEIGMNCMLVGVKDRYVLIDAGLMFPDVSDLGMAKVLPDTSFLHQWRDKIEAVIITHGHEDHIGALPWVLPALDPSTPVFTSAFVLQLVQRRLTEFSLFEPSRFRQFQLRQPFRAGPFEAIPIRVTHSIPDSCGLILRSDHGTIVHTGDFKIDENPIDGELFDRESFALLAKEPVALMMSDSTNVLSPGRSGSEVVVQKSVIDKVMGYQGKGRVIITQFASNVHRLHGVKAAAEASGRRICFVGASLSHYLEASHSVGRAPLDPRELLNPQELEHADPNKVLVVTTGSQAEPRAQLSLAALGASATLRLLPSDLLLYSAKVIPGNEPRVAQMLNSIAMKGARVVQGRGEKLHASGHACQEELQELLRSVRPQHFLPVHGEYAFLCEHARLAQEAAGVRHVQVIRDGQMLGVGERRSRDEVSSGSMAAATAAAAAAVGSGASGSNNSGSSGDGGSSGSSGSSSTMEVVGEVKLTNFFNDGHWGTGSAQEMALDERAVIAQHGIVVVAVEVMRDGPPMPGAPPPGSGGAPSRPPGLGGVAGVSGRYMRGRVKVTTRGMWTDQGALLKEVHEAVERHLFRLSADASLASVEGSVAEVVRRRCRAFNNRFPDVICIAHEHDPRTAVAVQAHHVRQRTTQSRAGRGAGGSSSGSSGTARSRAGAISGSTAASTGRSASASGTRRGGSAGSSSSSAGSSSSPATAAPAARRMPWNSKDGPLPLAQKAPPSSSSSTQGNSPGGGALGTAE